MTVAELAARHAAVQSGIARRASAELAALWAQIDRANIGASWRMLIPRALSALTAAQIAAVSLADRYTDGVLGAEDAAGRVLPSGFAGVASDGRPLGTLLQLPAITSLERIGAGGNVSRSLTSDRYLLDMITRTQVADAGRVAVGVAIAARPQATGYVRLVVGRTCARCLILAGRRYRWNAGFKRHPRCDCRHVPVAEDVPGDVMTDPRAAFDALPRADQDRVFGQAGAQAIREGADMSRVVNARRGIQTAADGRLYTTEAAGRRPRLMPEQIYREAGNDRAEAVRLLRLHGYLI